MKGYFLENVISMVLEGSNTLVLVVGFLVASSPTSRWLAMYAGAEPIEQETRIKDGQREGEYEQREVDGFRYTKD